MTEGGAKENWAVDELLKAEEEANNIIKNAQTERLIYVKIQKKNKKKEIKD